MLISNNTLSQRFEVMIEVLLLEFDGAYNYLFSPLARWFLLTTPAAAEARKTQLQTPPGTHLHIEKQCRSPRLRAPGYTRPTP